MCYVYPSDHPIFTHAVPRHPPILCEEDREAYFARVDAARKEILRAVANCPNTYNLLLAFYDGRITWDQLAYAMGGVHRTTAWRRIGRWEDEFRWARASDVARAALSRGEAFLADTKRGQTIRKPGYGVFLPNHRARFSQLPGETQVKAFLRAHAAPLNRIDGCRVYFGGLIDGGFQLALVVVFENLEQAKRLATRRGHAAILDARSHSVIRIATPQRTAA